MASIAIESHLVFNACLKCVDDRKEFMVNEEGDSLLTPTEEDTKFALLSMLSMTSYDNTTININSYEFALIKEYLA